MEEQKAALLQWYRQGFAVGGTPFAVAFGGANIWVANGQVLGSRTQEKRGNGGFMFHMKSCVCVFLLLACCALPMAAQQPASASANATVPQVVNFNGVLIDGKQPLTGMVGVTFSLYKKSQGGTALWMETQNLQLDKSGHYSAVLGSTTSHGLPAESFVSGEARWLGVQAQGQAEQPRVLLMSVPYALKALDAETIGGRPASAFMLAPPNSGAGGQNNAPPDGTITGGGTANFVPLFTGTTTIGTSLIFETAGGKVGVGTTTPTGKFDVKGTTDVRDTLTLFPKSTHPTLSVHGTAFSVSNTGVVTFVAGQTFPGTGTVTSVGSGSGLTGGPITTSGTMSIASGGVTNTMLQHSSLTVTANSPLTGGGAIPLGGSASLGLTSSCASGQMLKWNGSSWACAADDNSGGTVTSVGSGVGLTGGPVTGSGSLSINTSVVPQLGAANLFTNSNTVSINSSSPALSISNVGNGNGDGIDISLGLGSGIAVSGGLFGVEAVGATYPLIGSGGAAEGVFGESDTDTDYFPGILGIEGGSNARTLGVFGLSNSFNGSGVYGQVTSTRSEIGSSLFLGGSGVWGDGGSAGNIGLFGTADDNPAAYMVNRSSLDDTMYLENRDPEGSLFSAYNVSGHGCSIDAVGSINCTGSKNAVVPIDGGLRKVALSAIESPKNWFEDFGSEQLSNGTAVIRMEAEFAQTVNTQVEYHVFLTPKGDCKGLYVSNESASSFEVHELGGGTSAVRFDYRIVALRKNFENIRMADHTNDPSPFKMMKQVPPTHFDINKLIPPKRTARMIRPVTQMNEDKPGQVSKPQETVRR